LVLIGLERGADRLVHVEVFVGPAPTAEDDVRMRRHHRPIGLHHLFIGLGIDRIIGLVVATGEAGIFAIDRRLR
jgi:hypothetical protein